MNVVSSGAKYMIYDDYVMTYKELPAKTFRAAFNKMTGPYLVEAPNLSVKEKAYGGYDTKVEKVMNRFGEFNRSLGVILSGKKGIGKSFFTRMLADKAVKSGMPVIIVDGAFPGLVQFIDSIEQEVMVLFDEFDKTFVSLDDDGDCDTSIQDSLLSMFDGISQGKKLFVITCNEIDRLSEYLVNRPGRFHFHFRFLYPSADEVAEYLHDKLNEKYWDEIAAVVSFTQRTNLNYDCLRAIATELNAGESFENAIVDLNILNTDRLLYDIEVMFNNGKTACQRDVRTSFDRDYESFTLRDDESGYRVGYLYPDLTKVTYNSKLGAFELDTKFASFSPISYDNVDDAQRKDIIKSYTEAIPTSIKIKKVEFVDQYAYAL